MVKFWANLFWVVLLCKVPMAHHFPSHFKFLEGTIRLQENQQPSYKGHVGVLIVQSLKGKRKWKAGFVWLEDS